MRCRTIPVLLIGIFFSLASCLDQAAQTQPTASALRFHASDRNGKAMTQLTVADLELSDNGKAQSHIVTLQFAIAAGPSDPRLLRRGVDQGFVMQFDTDTLVTQNWTDHDPDI